MRAHRIAGNGIHLRVFEWPAEAPAAAPAPTLLYVHGWMDSGATFDLVAPRLASAGFRVLAIDNRGFGDSDRAPVGSYYHFPDYVADLAAVVDHLLPLPDASPFTLVGHSMGGSIATLYASARPGRISRLVNIEGLGGPAHSFTEGAARLSTWLDQLIDPRFGPARPAPRAMMLRRLCTGHPTVPLAILESRLDHLMKPVDAASADDAFVWKGDPRHRTTAPTPSLAELYKAHAARVTAPALFLAGGPTGYHPPDEADRLTAFRNLHTAVIPAAGHMIHWTHPAELAQHILDFAPPR